MCFLSNLSLTAGHDRKSFLTRRHVTAGWGSCFQFNTSGISRTGQVTYKLQEYVHNCLCSSLLSFVLIFLSITETVNHAHLSLGETILVFENKVCQATSGHFIDPQIRRKYRAGSFFIKTSFKTREMTEIIVYIRYINWRR